MDSEEIDPIAKKIRDAAIHNQEGTEAAVGERLLTADFARFARDLGPAELEKIEQLARARISKINAQGAPSQTSFHYENARRSIEAGIFSATFAIVTNGHFQLRLIVGLVLDANQRMAPLPIVETSTWHYRASADEDGFFWRDEITGERCLPDEIVNNALEALSDLLITPLQFADEDTF